MSQSPARRNDISPGCQSCNDTGHRVGSRQTAPQRRTRDAPSLFKTLSTLWVQSTEMANVTVTLCRRFSGGVRYYDPASRPFAYSQHRMISRIRVVVDLRRRGTLAIMQLPVRIDVVAAHAAGIKPLKTRQGPASVVLLRGRSISVDRSFSARARCRTTGI